MTLCVCVMGVAGTRASGFDHPGGGSQPDASDGAGGTRCHSIEGRPFV